MGSLLLIIVNAYTDSRDEGYITVKVRVKF